jgi:uncharacterized protein (TIGR02145 family)
MRANAENNTQIENSNELDDSMEGDVNNTSSLTHTNKTTTPHVKVAKVFGTVAIAILALVLIIIIINHLRVVLDKGWTSQVETPANPIYMQNWGGCNSLSVDDMVKLTDKRDGELYVVGKQADGKCWMLENLSLDLTNQQVQSKMNSSTTNASDATLKYLFNGGGSIDDQFAKETVADWSLSNNYNDYSRPLTYINLKDTSVETSTYISFGANERVGVYYNYCAASAGFYCYEKGVLKKDLDDTKLEITEDICPSGWSLPTKSDFDEFLNLKSPHHNVSYQNDTIVHKKLHTEEKIGSCSYGYDYNKEDYYAKNIKKLDVDSGTTKYWSNTTIVGSGGNTSVYALDIGLYNHPEIQKTSVTNGFTIRCLHR